MIVTRENFVSTLQQIVSEATGKINGLDTETTGLRWKDRLFSIQIATPLNTYYFNFNSCKDADGGKFPVEETLSRAHLRQMGAHLFSVPSITWAIHNAIYDLAMLKKEGIDVLGPIHCTRAASKVTYNEHLSYGLDACMEREFHERKNDTVKSYIKNHHHLTKEQQRSNTNLKNRINTRLKKLQNNPDDTDTKAELAALEALIIPKPRQLYDMVSIPGKATLTQRPYYHLVPRDVIVPYGEDDADQVRRLAEKQAACYLPKRPIWPVENKLSRICTDMQYIGLKVDRTYATAAYNYELEMRAKAESAFQELTGLQFKDGPKVLTEAFKRLDLSYPTTAKGNPSFKADVLEHLNNPVANIVTTIRHHAKNAGTYYSSFLHFSDEHSILHATPNPDIPRTGRFSYSGPNLQNVPKEEQEGLKYYMRKVFVPHSDEYVLFMPDYDQQEFKMMLDYANERRVIERVLEGEDLHLVTAELAGCTRKQAKTLNYGLLYGMGVAKLAAALDVEEAEARELKRSYFSALPNVQNFIRTCTKVAAEEGVLSSWAQRAFFFPNTDFAYKGANAVIQGGCADVLKIAMCQIYDFLQPFKSKMILQVHDELMFLVHKSELHLAPELVRIMEGVYKPRNGLYLTCSSSWSDKSWGYCDKIEGLPTLKKSA